jgi:hypothetical protein
MGGCNARAMRRSPELSLIQRSHNRALDTRGYGWLSSNEVTIEPLTRAVMGGSPNVTLFEPPLVLKGRLCVSVYRKCLAIFKGSTYMEKPFRLVSPR